MVQTCSDKPDSSPSARPDELHAKLKEGVGANEIWQEAGYAVKKNKAALIDRLKGGSQTQSVSMLLWFFFPCYF